MPTVDPNLVVALAPDVPYRQGANVTNLGDVCGPVEVIEYVDRLCGNLLTLTGDVTRSLVLAIMLVEADSDAMTRPRLFGGLAFQHAALVLLRSRLGLVSDERLRALVGA